MTSLLHALEPELAAVLGTVSIYCGRLDSPAFFVRQENVTHYAASTMKVAVMAAAYRLAESGVLDLDAEVPVHHEFPSSDGLSRYNNEPDYDSDDQVWDFIGRTKKLRWIVRRMIVKSGNLATNLVLEQTGFDAVQEILTRGGAKNSVVQRGIEDYPARETGLTNLVTAADLAVLLIALHAGRLAGESSTAEMLEVLHAQEVVDDVVRGLPPGTKVAHKNGWIDGVRHSAALIFPDDAPPFVLATCITAPISEQAGCDLIARVASAAWSDRHTLT